MCWRTARFAEPPCRPAMWPRSARGVASIAPPTASHLPRRSAGERPDRATSWSSAPAARRFVRAMPSRVGPCAESPAGSVIPPKFAQGLLPSARPMRSLDRRPRVAPRRVAVTSPRSAAGAASIVRATSSSQRATSVGPLLVTVTRRRLVQAVATIVRPTCLRAATFVAPRRVIAMSPIPVRATQRRARTTASPRARAAGPPRASVTLPRLVTVGSPVPLTRARRPFAGRRPTTGAMQRNTATAASIAHQTSTRRTAPTRPDEKRRL